MRQYSQYISTDGKQHFADVDVGDDAYYSVDLNNVIINPDATIESVEWDIPAGITSSDFYLLGKEYYNKLKTDVAGTFKIPITVSSSFGGKEITELSNVYLTVFA